MKKILLLLFACVATVTTAFAQGNNLLTNGGFESWTDGKPTDWQSTTTASSATLEQSTDAHSGDYAVLVKASASGNKRLAYKELNLEAGTYTFTIYGKGGGRIRLGYVPLDASTGKVGQYVYADYATTSADAWAQYSYTFELAEAAQVNLVVMNPKGTTDLLLDDAALTTENGGTGGDPVEPEPEDPAIFSEAFDASLGAFTADDVNLSDPLTYVWSWGGKNYGAKASAYVNQMYCVAESWLVSPVIDLTGATKVTLSFEQAANYFQSVENFQADCAVKVREEGGEWADLAYEGVPAGTSWTFVPSTADLSAYDGKKIQLGFQYTSSAERAGTWEVKNLVVDGEKSQTGIQDAVAGQNAVRTVIYSIDGRRLAAPVKGVNIINGQKVLVK